MFEYVLMIKRFEYFHTRFSSSVCGFEHPKTLVDHHPVLDKGHQLAKRGGHSRMKFAVLIAVQVSLQFRLDPSSIRGMLAYRSEAIRKNFEIELIQGLLASTFTAA